MPKSAGAELVFPPALACRRPASICVLIAEYTSEPDMGEEAIRLSRLRMPLPENVALDNPIAEMIEEGVGEAMSIVSTGFPGWCQDGTRFVIDIQPVKDPTG